MAARRFAPNDIVRVEKLATKTLERWRSTLGDHEDVGSKIQGLISIFDRLQTLFELDKSLQAQAAGNEDLADLLESAEATIASLYIFPDRLAMAAVKPNKKLHLHHRKDTQEQLREELKSAKEDVDDFTRAFSILLQRITESGPESRSDQSSVEDSRNVRRSMDSKVSSRASIDSRRYNSRYMSFSTSPTSVMNHPGSLVPGSLMPGNQNHRHHDSAPQNIVTRDPMGDELELHLQRARNTSMSPRQSHKLRMFYGVPAGAGSDPNSFTPLSRTFSEDSEKVFRRRPSSNPEEVYGVAGMAARQSERTFMSFSSGGSDDPLAEIDAMDDGLDPVDDDGEIIAELDGTDSRSRKSSRSSRPRLSRSGGYTPRASPPDGASLASPGSHREGQGSDLNVPTKLGAPASTSASISDHDSAGDKSATDPSSASSFVNFSPTSVYSVDSERKDSTASAASVRSEGEDGEDVQTPTDNGDIASSAPQITPFHFPSPLSPISMDL